jgi:hypothetical protein
MWAPIIGGHDRYVFYDGMPRKNVWNFMGTIHWDHLDIVGHLQITPQQIATVQHFYRALARLLWNLE